MENIRGLTARLSRLFGALVTLVVVIMLSGYVYQAVATTADKSAAPPPGKLVDIGGLNLHIHCIGTGGPTTVIAFGAGNWSIHWKPIQEQLSKVGRVCSYDRAGLGWSDPVNLPVSGQRLAIQLHELLSRAGEEPPYLLVGHSLGGYVTRIYHDKYPEEVAGMVLVESGHERQWDELPREVSELLDQAVANMRDASLLAQFGVLRFINLPMSDNLPTADQRKLLLNAMKTKRYYAAMIAYFEATPNMANEVVTTRSLIDLPLLVVSAGRSAYGYCGPDFGFDVPCEEAQRVWDRLQSDLATLSTNSRQVTIPTARHAIQLDAPDEVLEYITTMIQNVREARSLRAVVDD